MARLGQPMFALPYAIKIPGALNLHRWRTSNAAIHKLGESPQDQSVT